MTETRYPYTVTTSSAGSRCNITINSHEPKAAATGPAAIHRLMDEVLTTLLDVAADPSHLDEYAADVRTRLARMLVEG